MMSCNEKIKNALWGGVIALLTLSLSLFLVFASQAFGSPVANNTASTRCGITDIGKDSVYLALKNSLFDSAAFVQFPTWSIQAPNGGQQDDIQWYNASRDSNGFWYCDVPIPNHRNKNSNITENRLLTHMYAFDSSGNGYACITGTDNWIPSIIIGADITQTIRITSPNNLYLDYYVVGRYASSVTTVRYAVWSADNGQDDIRWFDITNGGGNHWTTNATLYEKGVYNIHVYIVWNGIQQFAGGGQVTNI